MLREGEGSRAGAPTETRRWQLGLEVDLDLVGKEDLDLVGKVGKVDLDLLGKEKKVAEERRG